MRWTISGAILISVSIGPRAATAFESTPCFPGALKLLAGEPTSSVAVGDFNRDFSLDLAVVASDSVAVFPGDGVGGFGPPTRLYAGSTPSFAAVADFNRDRKADLAVAGSGSLAILLGDGLGSFRPPSFFSGSYSARAIAIADFNGDKDPDVAVVSAYPEHVSVFLGDGAGGVVFSSSNRIPFSDVFALAAEDFNADGRPDLVVQTTITGVVVIFLGNGDGRFGEATWFDAGVSPMGLAVGDFNEDGEPDHAVANGTRTAASILLGDGLGGFGLAIPLGTGVTARGIATADFDSDGHADLAVAKEGPLPSRIEFYSGNGEGTFVGPFPYEAGTFPRQLAVGEFNRDGRPDVASSNYDGVAVSLNGGLTLFPETTSSLPPARVGVPYASPVFHVKGGSVPYSISHSGSLPPGITFSLSPPPAALRGTPSGPGEFRFTISVSSANGCSVEGTYILRVAKASPEFTLDPSASTIP